MSTNTQAESVLQDVMVKPTQQDVESAEQLFLENGQTPLDLAGEKKVSDIVAPPDMEKVNKRDRDFLGHTKKTTINWKNYVSTEDQQRFEQLQKDSGRYIQSEIAAISEDDAGGESQAQDRDYVIASTWASIRGDYNTLLNEADGRRVGIVLRGMPKGLRTIKELALAVRDKIGLDLKPGDVVPSISLNPEFFEVHAVTVAPTFLVLEQDEEQREVLRATGVSSPRWMDLQIKNGSKGDVGKWGEVHLVEETDFKADIIARAKEIDWAAAFKNAKEGFWKRQKWIALPTSRTSRTRLIDPTYTLPKDIKDAHGNVLVPAGTSYNPLQYSPWTSKLIIFDAKDPRQVEVAIEQSKKHPHTKFIVNGIPDMSFRGFGLLQERLGGKVYLLSGAIATRFRIETTPSLVEASGNNYLVTEIGVDSDGD